MVQAKMSLLNALLITVLACGVSANYTEQDVKNMKMIFCGDCKDPEVKKDLVAYGKCATTLYPEVSKKVLSLRSSLKDEPDECFAQVKIVIQDFSKADPEGTKKLEDCFHSNVNKDHLVKCH